MTGPASAAVNWSTVDEVTTIAFDDGKANALSFETIASLESAIHDAASSSRAIVLAGRAGFFSAGLDLQVVRSGDAALVQRLVERLSVLLRAMLNTPVPIVAACTGHALAGGALMLLAADLRVGAESDAIKIGLTEVSVGLALPAIGHELTSSRLDRRFSLRATAFAETVTPRVAVTWGYLDETTEGDVIEVATGRAREASARLDVTAFAATKIAANLTDAR